MGRMKNNALRDLTEAKNLQRGDGKLQSEEDVAKQIKLQKQSANAMKALNKAHPAMIVLEKLMEKIEHVSGLIEPFQDFIDIFWGGLEAGLADTAVRLAEALFTSENVEVMTKLGEAAGKLIEIGLEPSIALLERLLPLLERVIPLLDLFLDGLDRFDAVISAIYNVDLSQISQIGENIVNLFKNAFSIDWFRFFEGLVDDFKDAFEEFIEELFG